MSAPCSPPEGSGPSRAPSSPGRPRDDSVPDPRCSAPAPLRPTGLLVPLAVLVPRAAIAMVVLAEFGQWMSVIVYYVNTVSVRQALTPDRLRGRVNATMRFIAGGMLPIGALIGGALGTMLGLPATLVVAAFGMLLGVLWLYLSPVRTLRALPAIES